MLIANNHCNVIDSSILCTTCSHRDLCKYEDEYRKLSSSIRCDNNIDMNSIFTVSIGCKKYSSELTMTFRDGCGDYDSTAFISTTTAGSNSSSMTIKTNRSSGDA